MPAPAPSSSAIPSGAPIMARAMPWCGQGRGRLAGRPDRHRLHRRDRRSATPGRRSISVGARSPARCRTARPPANLVVAYEPVWAIGTGLTPTAADVAQVHAPYPRMLSARLGGEGGKMRILYGGSVKPSNAGELMASPMSTARWSAAPA